MNFPDIDNTPLGISRRENTHRYFQLPVALYNGLCAAIDAKRDYPSGGTLRGLQPAAELPKAPNGHVLIAIDKWRFDSTDEAMIAPYIAQGVLVELPRAAFEALLPVQELTGE